MDLSNGATGAGGGLIAAFFTWLGFKSKINDLDKRLDNISKNVIFSDVFGQFEKRFDIVYQQIIEMDKKIDKILYNNRWDGSERRR